MFLAHHFSLTAAIPPHTLLHLPVWRTNHSAALFANTPILDGLRTVAAGSCGFMRINESRPSENKHTTKQRNFSLTAARARKRSCALVREVGQRCSAVGSRNVDSHNFKKPWISLPKEPMPSRPMPLLVHFWPKRTPTRPPRARGDREPAPL